MFATEESVPWYRSVAVLIASCFLLPPAGLALLWTRKDWPAKTKALGTVAILLLSTGYFYFYSAWRRTDLNDQQYSALEQHRAQQAQALAATTDQSTAANPTQPAGAVQQRDKRPASLQTDPAKLLRRIRQKLLD